MTHAGQFAPPPESVAGPEASTAPPAASPPVVEGYLVSRCVARFAGGELYLADARQGTSRQVMIEWQPDGLARYSRRERLLKEAAGRVAHRNVSAFVEYGRTPQGSYLVIEPAGGALFTSSWNYCPLPPREAAAMIESVARGIHQAHLRGLAHGSLGLGKVMIDADGAPVVFGFGLWSSFSQRQGSPWEVCYLAPEQIAQPEAEPTLAADVYAAGAMLYALLTGRPPFLGSSAQETARQVTRHKLVAPRALARGIPADLEAICAACLSKSSAGRYESAEELANDLARYLASEPVHARRGPLKRLRGWWRGRPVAATASVAAVVAALAGPGWSKSGRCATRPTCARRSWRSTGCCRLPAAKSCSGCRNSTRFAPACSRPPRAFTKRWDGATALTKR